MLSSLNDIKIGLCIDHENEPWQVIRANFVRMQQRKPVMQTTLKNLINGRVLNITFKPGDRVEEANLERNKASFLYKDQNSVNFMDQESYEQFSFEAEMLGDKINFLKEGQEVTIIKFNGQPVNVVLPPKVDLKVNSAFSGVRGDTAQGLVTKDVTVETGITVKTPLFVKEGDTIRVNTQTGEYVERV